MLFLREICIFFAFFYLSLFVTCHEKNMKCIWVSSDLNKILTSWVFIFKQNEWTFNIIQNAWMIHCEHRSSENWNRDRFLTVPAFHSKEFLFVYYLCPSPPVSPFILVLLLIYSPTALFPFHTFQANLSLSFCFLISLKHHWSWTVSSQNSTLTLHTLSFSKFPLSLLTLFFFSS